MTLDAKKEAPAPEAGSVETGDKSEAEVVDPAKDTNEGQAPKKDKNIGKKGESTRDKAMSDLRGKSKESEKQNENLDGWYQNSLYERLTKKWAK